MTLLLNSIAHFLVDGVCCCSLFAAAAGGQDITAAILLYNTLAFSTQCIAGLVLDKTGNAWNCARIAMAVVAVGGLLPIGIIPKVIIVGLGNSLFHVAGGMMTMMKHRGRSKELGLFVAPGAFGVTFGTFFPGLGPAFAVLLLLCGALMGHVRNDDYDYDAAPPDVYGSGRESVAFPVLPVILLTAAVAVRAVGGSAVTFPWKTGAAESLVMTAFVFAGKALGGFVRDRMGTLKTSIISIVPSAVCIAFFSAYMIPALAGQFLLNLTMPVTLWMLYELIPDSPGLAFGLAASALWPGTVIGMLFKLTGPALWICVTASFLFGLLAIIFCERRIEK